jgi:hypothetical protein
MRSRITLLICVLALILAPWCALAQTSSGLPAIFGVARPGAGKSSSSSGITIGTTAITGGTSGGELFQTATGKVGSDSGFTYAGAGGVLTLTPAANTAQPFLITGGSTTGSSTSALGLSVVGTLNTSGVVDGAALFANVTNTASGAGSLIIDLQAGGASVFSLGFDTPLIRDAAATIAQRNTTTAQTFRVYNTFTSATSYERGTFDWNDTANVLTIGTEKGSGGGSVRNMEFVIGGTNQLDYGVTGAGTWTFKQTANINAGGGGLVYTASIGTLAVVFNTAVVINPNAQGGIVLGLLNYYGFASSSFGLTADTGLGRNAAGVVEVNSGTLGTINGSIKPANFISGGSVPVDGGGSCTVTTFAGGATAGTFVGPVGACAAGTVAITFAFTAPTGWSCDATDRTTAADTIKQTASTTTKATFAATLAASDVVQYKCIAY